MINYNLPIRLSHIDPWTLNRIKINKLTSIFISVSVNKVIFTSEACLEVGGHGFLKKI